MSYLSRNWFWLIILAGFLAMHMFAHDGHGFQRGHVDSHADSKATEGNASPNAPVTGPTGTGVPADKGTGK